MNLLTTSLFASEAPLAFGVGYHNIERGCLCAAQPDLVRKLERRYGQRCGHLPLDAERACVLVDVPTPEIDAQWAYLSQLFSKTVTPLSPQDLAMALRSRKTSPSLVVPYINVPQTERWIEDTLGSPSWGLPGQMVQMLIFAGDVRRAQQEVARLFEWLTTTTTRVSSSPRTERERQLVQA